MQVINGGAVVTAMAGQRDMREGELAARLCWRGGFGLPEARSEEQI